MELTLVDREELDLAAVQAVLQGGEHVRRRGFGLLRGVACAVGGVGGWRGDQVNRGVLAITSHTTGPRPLSYQG